jgi:ABC-type multidrug transport system fused ATPase/permease subunit
MASSGLVMGRKLVPFVRPHWRYALATLGFGVGGFALSFAYPWIVGSLVDLLTAGGDASGGRRWSIGELALLALLAAGGHALTTYGRGHNNTKLGHAVVADVRRALFRHIQRLSVSYFTNERIGSVLAHILHDVQEATTLLYMGIIVVILDVAHLIIALCLLFALSAKLTLACLALFPLYALLFKVTNPRIRKASERMHTQFSAISGNLTEQLAGQALIKIYTAEEREAQRFDRDLARYHQLVMAQSREGHHITIAAEGLVNLGTTIVIGFGGWLALHSSLASGLTPGGITRFLGYMLIMFGPIRRFADLNTTYQTSFSALARVLRIFDIQPTITDPPVEKNAITQAPAHGHVRFDNVTFRYDDNNNSVVLDGISLEARPGERIAIVGRSGSGKSTLISLLPRLYDTTDGAITIDGVNVRDFALKTLRQSIAIVQQDTFIFSGTIRDNLAYANPDATDEEIEQAARDAHAHEFIAKLPDRYDTILGERGVNLSGGQRQRLSIARAILKNPKILIFDEATSALDAESEAIVQRALDALMRGRTCFVVAHRLSTIKDADRIIVLDDDSGSGSGRISEEGTHAELLANTNGTYARLVRHQTTPAAAAPMITSDAA